MLAVSKGKFIANEEMQNILNRALENSMAMPMLLIFAKAAWIMTSRITAKR
jgi:hypothetical protein